MTKSSSISSSTDSPSIMLSNKATSSASTEFFVTICCFLQLSCTNVLPNMTKQADCPFPSACVANDASIFVITHSKLLLSIALVHDLVSCRYPNILSNLCMSSIVGAYTLVHRNCTGIKISGLPRFPKYKSFCYTWMKFHPILSCWLWLLYIEQRLRSWFHILLYMLAV